MKKLNVWARVSGVLVQSYLLDGPCLHGICLQAGIFLVRLIQLTLPCMAALGSGSPQLHPWKLREESSPASVPVSTVLLLSKLTQVRLMDSVGPLVALISLFALAATKLTAKPVVHLQKLRRTLKPKCLCTSLPRIRSCCLTLAPLHSGILIYIGCPAVFYVFATRRPRWRRGGFIDVLALLSLHEDRAGKSIWATGWERPVCT